MRSFYSHNISLSWSRDIPDKNLFVPLYWWSVLSFPALGQYCPEHDVVANGSFIHCLIFGVLSSDLSRIRRWRLIPVYFPLRYLRYPFYAVVCNVTDTAVFIFFHAAFHYPGQYDFVRKDILAGFIIDFLRSGHFQVLVQDTLSLHPFSFPLFYVKVWAGFCNIYIYYTRYISFLQDFFRKIRIFFFINCLVILRDLPLINVMVFWDRWIILNGQNVH